MPNDEDKSRIDERLTGVRDPKDPDGLLTVDGPNSVQDATTYGHEETDTLEKEQQRNREHGLD